MTNNSGELTVVDYRSALEVIISFPSTGFTTSTKTVNIATGKVKDLLLASVCGIGFFGDGKYNSKSSAYSPWVSMLCRCYNQQGKDYSFYGAKGITVCEEWHNFQNFAAWYEPRFVKGHQLDKDILSGSVKVYSPETCMLVTPADNSIKANAKHYTFLSPNGDVVEVYNLNAFCRDNGLTQQHMTKVHSGQRPHHKQWRKG